MLSVPNVEYDTIKKKSGENVCVVNSAVRCGELDYISSNGEKIGGNGNVVVEENDENTMDCQKIK